MEHVPAEERMQEIALRRFKVRLQISVVGDQNMRRPI
jgi:hypothetical protein